MGRRTVVYIQNVNARELTIKARFEEKERNCTIKGEGYAERQIAKSLELAGKIDTSMGEKDVDSTKR